jgi:hypothetical protein
VTQNVPIRPTVARAPPCRSGTRPSAGSIRGFPPSSGGKRDRVAPESLSERETRQTREAQAHAGTTTERPRRTTTRRPPGTPIRVSTASSPRPQSAIPPQSCARAIRRRAVTPSSVAVIKETGSSTPQVPAHSASFRAASICRGSPAAHRPSRGMPAEPIAWGRTWPRCRRMARSSSCAASGSTPRAPTNSSATACIAVSSDQRRRKFRRDDG